MAELPLRVRVRYPRQAQSGVSYLMTVDVEFNPAEVRDWPANREELRLDCYVSSQAFTLASPNGVPLLLHRYGGTYGEATFLLRAVREIGEGEIRLALHDERRAVGSVALAAEVVAATGQPAPAPLFYYDAMTGDRNEKVTAPLVFAVLAPGGVASAELPGVRREGQILRDLFAAQAGLELLMLEDVTFARVRAVLQNPAFRDRLTVFHFAGHLGGEWLDLPDEEGNPVAVGQLTQMLAGLPALKLVYLSACSSDAYADALLASGAGAVVGTMGGIDDESASMFAEIFFGHLLRGRSVAEAFHLADVTTPMPPDAMPPEEPRPWTLSVRNDAAGRWTLVPPPVAASISFGSFLSDLLEQRKRTPTELARALPIHPEVVVRWLKKNEAPDNPQLVESIATYLQLAAQQKNLLFTCAYLAPPSPPQFSLLLNYWLTWSQIQMPALAHLLSVPESDIEGWQRGAGTPRSRKLLQLLVRSLPVNSASDCQALFRAAGYIWRPEDGGNFAALLKQYLAQQGRTQAWLAARLGISEASVSRWVRGESLPGARQRIDEMVRELGIAGEEECTALYAAAGYPEPPAPRAQVAQSAEVSPDAITVPENASIGFLLRHYLEKRDLSVDWLAQQVSVKPATVKRWLQDQSVPSLPHVAQIAQALELSDGERDVFLAAAMRSQPQQIASEQSDDARLVDRPTYLWVNVPPPPTPPLIGRRELLDRYAALLTSGKARTLAFYGPAGMGKTALATALVYDERVRKHFDGVLWATLGKMPDAAGILNQWAAAAGIQIVDLPDLSQRVRRLSAALGNRRVLVVLDEAWDADVPALIRLRSPGVVHLLTTRSQKAADSFEGGSGAMLHLLPLASDDAYSFLRQLAPSACEFFPNETRALAKGLDGMPLALSLLGRYLAAPEHAGVGIAGFSPSPADLDRRVQLALRQLAPRGSKLEALEEVIQLAFHDVARANAQALQTFYGLCAFAPHPATFDLEAAEAVAGATSEILALLESYHLIEIGADGELSIQAIIASAGPGAPLQSLQVFGSFYLARADAWRNDMQRLDVLYPQIRHALETLQAGDESLYRWNDVLTTYWQRRGLSADALRWQQAAYDLAVRQRDTRSQAAFLTRLGSTYLDSGRIQEAQAQFDSALPLYEMRRDPLGHFAALSGLGQTYFELGEMQEALTYYERALLLADRSETLIPGALRGRVMSQMGAVYAYLEDRARAAEFYEQALSMQHAVQDTPGEAATLQRLAQLRAAAQEWPEARDLYEHALSLYHAAGDMRSEAQVLLGLGDISLAVGALEQAQVSTEQALAMFQRLADLAGEAQARFVFGAIQQRMGKPQHALVAYEAALALSRTLNDRLKIAQALNEIGEIQAVLGNQQASQAAFAEALRLTQEVPAPQVLSQRELVQRSCAVILEAFARHELALILRVELGTRLDTIVANRSFSDQVFELVEYFARREQLPELLKVLAAANPHNSRLAELAAVAQMHGAQARQGKDILGPPSVQAKANIFLAYTRQDAAFMHRLRLILAAQGILLWVDEDQDVPPGTLSWQRAIQDAIRDTACTVVLLSPAALESHWVNIEIEYAKRRSKRIFPILVAGNSEDAVPLSLVSVQYVDAREDFDRAISARLLPALQRYLASV
jgi:tetratricopeptide (TPR) repeat protein/transcriptional regulator with XRE-family HTH domain